MQYEVIRQNEDGTAHVRMIIDGHILEQAFDPTNLDENVKQGMAVFNSELERNITPTPEIVDISSLIGVVETVEGLPPIEEPQEEPIPEEV